MFMFVFWVLRVSREPLGRKMGKYKNNTAKYTSALALLLTVSCLHLHHYYHHIHDFIIQKTPYSSNSFSSKRSHFRAVSFRTLVLAPPGVMVAVTFAPSP